MLTGSRAAPFTLTRVVHAAAGAELFAPRAMRVARLVRETADAVTLYLEDLSNAPVAFAAGQFFTVLATVEGEALRRAYSASSSPRDRQLSITVKRVAGGKVSNHLNDHVREGMTLNLLGPSGTFGAAAVRARELVFFAGGSGITPILSIVRAVLAEEPEARLAIVYGNRSEEDIIFRAELLALSATHGARFVVRHVLGEKLDRDRAAAELAALSPSAAAEYFVCGPEPMMNELREALAAGGVAPARLHEERFTAPHLRTRPRSPAGEVGRTMLLRGSAPVRERRVLVAAGQTVLEAGLGAGEAMPFSCAMGGCGACKVKLEEGEVDMEEPSCLSREERAAGYVLACVARPRGPIVVQVP